MTPLLLPRLPRRDDLLDQLRRTSELSREGKYDEALEVAREVAAACAAARVESAHVFWALAVMNDCAGKLLDALKYVLMAIRADPLMVPAEQSLGIIVGRCRKKVVEGAWDESAAPLYQALAENGLADDACRVACAAYLHEKGQHEEALRVAEAVALLNPRLAEAWRIVGAAATALGNHKLAEEAAGRCMAARCSEGPAPAPNVQWGQA